MPPKKKIKESATPQQILPEPQCQQNLLQIPKKPFYRSVNLNSFQRAKRVRIKLWKIDSLKFTITERYMVEDLVKHQDVYRVLSRLHNQQRVFKNLRRLECSSNNAKALRLKKMMLKSSRPEKLLLHCYDYSPFSHVKLIRKSLNPHLKDFFLDEYYVKPPESSIDGCKYLVNCNIRLRPSLVFNTKGIRSLTKYLKGRKKDQVIECIEGFRQYLPVHLDREKDILFDISMMNAAQLPNLKALKFNYRTDYQNGNSNIPLDFIKNYSQLVSLWISFYSQETPLLDFLNFLPNLKQLSLRLPEEPTQTMPKSLPLISSLEKLYISCKSWEFSPENVQEFLISNKGLKYLEIEFHLQDDFIIFDENLVLPVETLKLFIGETGITAVKKLALFLRKHRHLKSLTLVLSDKVSLDHSEILLKELASMTSLKHLTCACLSGRGEIQENKLKSLKNILMQSPGIQELELDIGVTLKSKDFSNLLDGLVHLKKLKYLWIRGAFLKVSPATISKLVSYLRFLVFENTANVVLHLDGIAKELMEEINSVIRRRHDLYGEKMRFEYHQIPYYSIWERE